MRAVSVCLPVLTTLALAGCITEEEYNEVKAQRDKLRERVAKLEEEVDKGKGLVKELENRLSDNQKADPMRPSQTVKAAAFSELELGQRDSIRAIMHTNQGDIECILAPTIAPLTVLNFVGLAEGTKEWTDPSTGKRTKKKLYDGTIFHRVVNGFMIQGGDPLGTGRGGPGYTFPDEIWPDRRFDRPGTLAMANSGPNTNGSQFFITGAAAPTLNGRHTIFGLCETETVLKIMKVPTGGPDNERPIEDVVVERMEIVRIPGGAAD